LNLDSGAGSTREDAKNGAWEIWNFGNLVSGITLNFESSMLNQNEYQQINPPSSRLWRAGTSTTRHSFKMLNLKSTGSTPALPLFLTRRPAFRGYITSVKFSKLFKTLLFEVQ
jgi:hypothetical protein